jgi:coenzyme PQQ biosynthesis protein PqqD
VGSPALIAAGARPRLADKARIRFDRKTERTLLLYPEKGLELNPTAADIARLCTGEHTLTEMVDRLVDKYPRQPRSDIEREMLAFLDVLGERGLVRYEG